MASPNTQQPQHHVLIIGAGVCGLAIAQGLQKAQIPFTIFEAEDEHAFRPREWTMAMHWSVPMLESLLPDDLAARIPTDAVVDRSIDYTEYPNNTLRIFDGPSGQIVKEITPEGRILRVSRRKLRALCAEGIQVNYGHVLQKISYGNDDGTVTAWFTNGASYNGTLLVGSDGPDSCAREQIFGAEAAKRTPIDVEYTNVTFQYPDASLGPLIRKTHPITSVTVHPNFAMLLSVQDVPDPKRPETWRFQLVMMWKKHGSKTLIERDMPNEERQKLLKDKAADLKEPFRSAVLQMPADVQIRPSGLGYWKPEPWDTHDGRVTLAGDAAHPMPPNRGQGLNNAINDAYNLVDALKKLAAGQGDQGDVIRDFSNEVIERGGKEVLLSTQTAYTFLEYEKMADSGLMKYGVARKPEP